MPPQKPRTEQRQLKMMAEPVQLENPMMELVMAALLEAVVVAARVADSQRQPSQQLPSVLLRSVPRNLLSLPIPVCFALGSNVLPLAAPGSLLRPGA